MKKILCILLALCLMLTAFAGCNKEDDSTKDETEKTTVEAPKEEPEEVQLVGVWTSVHYENVYNDLYMELTIELTINKDNSYEIVFSDAYLNKDKVIEYIVGEYQSALTEDEIQKMLDEIGCDSLEDYASNYYDEVIKPDIEQYRDVILIENGDDFEETNYILDGETLILDVDGLEKEFTRQ